MSERPQYNKENSQESWDLLKEQNFDPSFNVVENWIRKNSNSISAFNSRRKKTNLRRKLALVFFFALLFSCSLILKTESRVKYADLFIFQVDRNNPTIIAGLTSLRDELNLESLVFTNKPQSAQLSCIALVGNKQLTEKFTGRLKRLGGIKRLNITPIQYKVTTSLFSKFLHDVFGIEMRTAKPDSKELEKDIQIELKKNGVDDRINLKGNEIIILSNPGDLINNVPVDTAIKQNVGDTAFRKPIIPGDNIRLKSAGLDQFNWLIGPWKVKNVPHNTWHFWKRINDSLLKCFVLEVDEDEKIKRPPGFSIQQMSSGEIVLMFNKAQWKFIPGINGDFDFKNPAELNPGVKWVIKDQGESWQSMIYSDNNAEFINFIREDPLKFDKMINALEIPHPRSMQ